MRRDRDRYPSTALQPMQVSCFLAKFDGEGIEIDLV